MMIAVTYKCSMGCSHCISDCNPDGEHMSVDTFTDAMDFLLTHRVPVWVISGGEMFEHPHIEEILDALWAVLRADNYTAAVTLTTNGQELANNDKLLNMLSNMSNQLPNLFTQVTYDPRFYPKQLSYVQQQKLKSSVKNLVIEEVPHHGSSRKQCLYPQGRAVNYTESWYFTKGPKCGNVRLLAKQTRSFQQLLMGLTMHRFSCTPVIAPDGSIKCGESALCPKVASIYDSDEEIMQKIRAMSCQSCQYSFEQMKETNPAAYKFLMSEV